MKDLLDGKEVIKKAMTEELDRAIEAYDRAKLGKKVALISSGDAGVYGMAGPTFEVLFQAGWTPDAASRSRSSRRLGDQHLRLAGRRAADARLLRHLALRPADAVADHRPSPRRGRLWPTSSSRSTTRRAAAPRQIQEAQRIFLRHRDPNTPVAIVKSAFRAKQRIEFTDAGQR